MTILHREQPQSPPSAATRDQECALALRAIGGDDAAFEEIVARFEEPIFKYVSRFMGHRSDPDDARDLTQDTFLKAWLAIGRGQLGPDAEGHIKVISWLYRIATNVCRDALRHRKLVSFQDWDEYLSMPHPTQVAGDDPAREARDAETRREVRAVLDAIPAAHHYGVHDPRSGAGALWRDALVLREWGDLSYREIAAVLCTTPHAVKSILHRARVAFKEIWEARDAGQQQPERGVVA